MTEQIVGSRFPQTTTKYRCTNEECQDKKDTDAAKRMLDQKGREQAKQERETRIRNNRIAARISLGKTS